jgi:hypothetical protein
MEKNQWAGTPYEKEIRLSKKWEERAGYQLSWPEVVICELLSDSETAAPYLPKSLEGSNTPINAFTSIYDFCKITGDVQRLISEIEDPDTGRRFMSPNWTEGRKLFAKELRDELQLRDLPADYQRTFTEWIGEPFTRERIELKQLIFRDVMSGKKCQIKDYSGFLFEYRTELFAEFFQTLLSDMARAAAIAHVIRELEENDEGDVGRPTQLPINPNQRLEWIGKPEEFTTIILILIEKGFIADYSNKNQLAKIAMQSFKIHSNRGEEVSIKTLKNLISKGFAGFDREYSELNRKFPTSETLGKGEK